MVTTSKSSDFRFFISVLLVEQIFYKSVIILFNIMTSKLHVLLKVIHNYEDKSIYIAVIKRHFCFILIIKKILVNYKF